MQKAASINNKFYSFLTTVVYSFVFLLFCSMVHANETVNDEKLGFSMELPDGFKKYQSFANSDKTILYAWILGNPSDEYADIIVFVRGLNGPPLRQEYYSLNQLPKDFKGKLLRVKWNKFKLNGFEIPENINGVSYITYNIQIPLKKEPVQISIFGTAEEKDLLKHIMNKVMAKLDGASNWREGGYQTAPLKKTPEDKSNIYGWVLLSIGIILFIGGLVLLMFISRKSSKWAVLGLSILFYFGGISLSSLPGREGKMVSGFLKTFGFAGIILGCFDVLRKRKKEVAKDETTENSREEDYSRNAPHIFPPDLNM